MGSPDTVTIEKDIILFDGVCNLCNGAVQFILKRDPRGYFVFASLQSSFAKDKLKAIGAADVLETMVLVRGNTYFQRSEAALEIAKKLKGIWPSLYVFKIIPRFIRDTVYNWIAKNRYRFFGKQETCMLPSPDWKDRFVE